jgi:hypothetical protein
MEISSGMASGCFDFAKACAAAYLRFSANEILSFALLAWDQKIESNPKF